MLVLSPAGSDASQQPYDSTAMSRPDFKGNICQRTVRDLRALPGIHSYWLTCLEMYMGDLSEILERTAFLIQKANNINTNGASMKAISTYEQHPKHAILDIQNVNMPPIPHVERNQLFDTAKQLKGCQQYVYWPNHDATHHRSDQVIHEEGHSVICISRILEIDPTIVTSRLISDPNTDQNDIQ